MADTNRWKQQWTVPSNSGGKDHKVSEDQEGNYFCDCWPFRRNRACKHIDVIKSGGGTLIGSLSLPEPPMQFWEIDQVTPEIANGKILYLKVPLVPFGDSHAHFTYTVFYDLMLYGVKWSTIRTGYSAISDRLTEADVRNVIRERGRCVKGPWQKNPNGEGGDWGPYEITHEDPPLPPKPKRYQTFKVVSPDGEETLRCPSCGWKSSALFVITDSLESAAQHEDAICADCFCGDVRDDYPVVIRAHEAHH